MSKNVFILFLMLIGCKLAKEKPALNIVEGQGIAEINLFKSTIDDVKNKFGDGYKVIEWGNHSIEYNYKNLGVSFSHKQNSNDGLIAYLDIFPTDFVGRTEKGLKIHEDLRISDVTKIYGEPTWNYTLDSTELYAEYDGIDFQIIPNLKFTTKFFLEDPKQDTIHLNYYENSIVKEISLTL